MSSGNFKFALKDFSIISKGALIQQVNTAPKKIGKGFLQMSELKDKGVEGRPSVKNQYTAIQTPISKQPLVK